MPILHMFGGSCQHDLCDHPNMISLVRVEWWFICFIRTLLVKRHPRELGRSHKVWSNAGSPQGEVQVVRVCESGAPGGLARMMTAYDRR